jgi:hypothetical protein
VSLHGSESGSSRRTPAVIAIVVALLLVASALAWHAHARSAYWASISLGVPLETRYADAYTAAALEPWNSRYTDRSRYVAAWLRADTLLSAGASNEAVALLSATIGRTLAEPDLLALYHKAQAAQAVDTNRKAHLQHAHEGPGGTLRPSDIER